MSFPDDPRDLKVQIAFGHTWRDDLDSVTWVQVAPGADDDDPGDVLGGISIARGRIGDAPRVDATQIEFALRNTDGRYSPRNVSGPFYGQFLDGTPVRVLVDVGSGDEVLATAFVPEWNPTWRGPGMDDRVNINAEGILALLGRDRVSQSALRRYIESQDPDAYWTMDTATSGTTEMRAEHTDGDGVVPEWTTASMSDALEPGWTSVGRTVIVRPISAGVRVSAATITTAVSFNCMISGRPNELGDAPGFTLSLADIYPVTWAVTVSAYWAGGSPDLELASGTSGFIAASSAADAAKMWDDGAHHIQVYMEQSGADAAIEVYVDGTLSMSGTAPSISIDGSFVPILIVGNGADVVWSHVAVWAGAGPAASDFYEAAIGHDGEAASDRVTRVCAEAGILVDVTAGDSAAMGPQPVGTVLQVLRECEDADHGVLGEGRGGRLDFAPNSSRYNASVALTLDCGTEMEPGDISTLRQFDDNRDVRNRVTVTRAGGSSVTAEETDGPVGIGAIGVRPLPVRLNLHEDSQVSSHAGWLLRAGTVDKPRYTIVLDLRANEHLRSAATALAIGSRIQVTGAPAQHVGPNTLDLIVEGERSGADAVEWLAALWCEPDEPWRVQQLTETPPDDDLLDGWYIPDSCELNTGVDEAETTWLVDIDPLMTTAAEDFPCRIGIGGEEVHVTACSGASSPQTWTVTRSVNGVVKAHSAGAEIELLDPLVLTL